MKHCLRCLKGSAAGRESHFPSALPSPGWTDNRIDTRQINERTRPNSLCMKETKGTKRSHTAKPARLLQPERGDTRGAGPVSPQLRTRAVELFVRQCLEACTVQGLPPEEPGTGCPHARWPVTGESPPGPAQKLRRRDRFFPRMNFYHKHPRLSCFLQNTRGHLEVPPPLQILSPLNKTLSFASRKPPDSATLKGQCTQGP